MNTTTAQVTLRQLQADIRQLVEPIQLAVQGRIVTHDPLLDQLRQATAPSGASASVRIQGAAVAPVNLAAIDALSTIYVELAGWHARQSLPSPPRDGDWQKHTLRALLDRAPTLAPAVAEWLATEVRDWWALAARHTGWKTQELTRIR